VAATAGYVAIVQGLDKLLDDALKLRVHSVLRLRGLPNLCPEHRHEDRN
jgi:hypothetical protein